MTSEKTFMMERHTGEAHRHPSGVKTILLHIQNDKSLEQRLETALSLARACEAHVSCLHITPIEAYVAFDSFGGIFVMNDVIKALDKEEERIREETQAQLLNEDVSWDYVQVTGNVPQQLVRHAALADLVVTGREPHREDFDKPTISLLGDLLERMRTPLFIPAGNGAQPDLAGTAVIAWDGSYEACNAVRGAVGLLRLASDVRVIQVREKDKEDVFPGTQLLQYLSRHGVHAELQLEAPEGARGEQIADLLLAKARAEGAAYVVMGGYNHSRVGQFLFGGVTRSLLSDSPLPLLMSG